MRKILMTRFEGVNMKKNVDMAKRPLHLDGLDVEAMKRLAAKASLHESGGIGPVWRLMQGALRLDRTSEGAPQFAGLALPGDLVGAELMLHGCYGYTVRALVPSVLMVWPHQHVAPSHEAVVQSCMQVQQRTAGLMSLRSGSAEERVSRLILMLASEHDTQLVLPTLTDMAEINDLAMESVSRAMTRLRQFGALSALPRRHQFVLQRARLSDVGHALPA